MELTLLYVKAFKMVIATERPESANATMPYCLMYGFHVKQSIIQHAMLAWAYSLHNNLQKRNLWIPIWKSRVLRFCDTAWSE